MNSLVERLVESWLDKQTERRYQSAFVQLLVSDGWTVLHNTRHSPIEFGKDVIARDISGKLFCFQLKGNPGSRVSKAEAQQLLPQLVELLQVGAPEHLKASSAERHVAVFVTNGEADEEARTLFEMAARCTEKPICSSDRFEIWARGRLLSDFKRQAGTVWPTSLEGSRLILEIFGGSGLESPDPVAIAKMLRLSAPVENLKSNPARDAAVAALLLLCEIIKDRWYRSNNHYALFVVTVICCVYVLGLSKSDPKRIAAVKNYSKVCITHCLNLMEEARERHFDPRKIWSESDPLAEFDIMGERRRLMGDMIAAFILNQESPQNTDDDFAIDILKQSCRDNVVWGLGLLPSSIVRYWALCRVDATNEGELMLAHHLKNACIANSGRFKGMRPLSGPYYNFFDIWAKNNDVMFVANDQIREDSPTPFMWFGRAIMFILAKRNYKSTCKKIWPLFSHCVHQEVKVPKENFFNAEICHEGSMEQFTYRAENWGALLRFAVDDSEAQFLEEYSGLAWLIAAYVSIVPYRAWTPVLMWLDAKLNRTFYNKSFLPE